MPEGDTIFRAARTLHAALAGRAVTRFVSMFPALLRTPLEGRTVEGVHAAGKHLLIDFSGGLTLRTHMRMNGSWHLYRSGERWRRPRDEMRIVIETGAYVAVAFLVPVAELLDQRALERQPELRALGPDILAPEFDAAAVLPRVRERDGEEIANILLNQRVVAGIGNIWKSESLFAAKVNPFRKAAELDDATLIAVLTAARKLMRASASPDGRPRFNVYSRGGQPCRRCGTAIAYRKQGLDARGTYWCTKCQGDQ